jgi:hypothetical protein
MMWAIPAEAIAVPQIAAAMGATFLPFAPLSAMMTHIEDRWAWSKYLVVGAIGLPVYLLRAYPPMAEPTVDPEQHPRTPGGRFTLGSVGQSVGQKRYEFDDSLVPTLLFSTLTVVVVFVSLATWAAVKWWDDPHHYHPAYVLYGSIVYYWFLLPELIVLFGGRDVPFPTLYRTVRNLDEWLRSRPLPRDQLLLLVALFGYTVSVVLYVLLHIVNPRG